MKGQSWAPASYFPGPAPICPCPRLSWVEQVSILRDGVVGGRVLSPSGEMWPDYHHLVPILM